MGCCEFRELQRIEMSRTLQTGDSASKGNETDSTHSRLSDFAQNFEIARSCFDLASGKLRQIEEYAYEAIKDSEWVSHIERPDFAIRTRPQTIYSAEVPASLAFIDFGSALPAEAIVKKLIDPETRMRWDQSIDRMDLICGVPTQASTLRIIKKYPFVFRELIVEASVSTQGKTTTVVMHSISYPESQINQSLERGEVLFIVYKIIETSGTTLLMCMQQVDNKSGISKLFSTLMASALTQWVYSLKKACKTIQERSGK